MVVVVAVVGRADESWAPPWQQGAQEAESEGPEMREMTGVWDMKSCSRSVRKPNADGWAIEIWVGRDGHYYVCESHDEHNDLLFVFGVYETMTRAKKMANDLWSSARCRNSH